MDSIPSTNHDLLPLFQDIDFAYPLRPRISLRTRNNMRVYGGDRRALDASDPVPRRKEVSITTSELQPKFNAPGDARIALLLLESRERIDLQVRRMISYLGRRALVLLMNLHEAAVGHRPAFVVSFCFELNLHDVQKRQQHCCEGSMPLLTQLGMYRGCWGSTRGH